MSFDDELDKLQRVRRAYLRFASDLNPSVQWVGDTDRRYAKVADNRGDIPVKGTVEGFGSFKNFIANQEYTIEVPSSHVSLIDANNEWRALADRPSYLLLHRFIAFHVLVHDDSDALLDQMITVGQIASPRFPQGHVEFDVSIPGGEYLGETVPRRLLTTADWPRALPDDLGKVIPFVYGSLVNTPPSQVELTTTTPGSDGCARCSIEDWTGDLTSLFYDDFESYGGDTLAFEAVYYNIYGGPAGNPLQQANVFDGDWACGVFNAAIGRAITATTDTFVFGIQMYWTGVPPLYDYVATFTQHPASDGFNFQVHINVNNSGQLYVHSHLVNLGTSPRCMVNNQWNCITGVIRIREAPDGAFKLYCNGDLVLEVSGVDTVGSLYSHTGDPVYNQQVQGVYTACSGSRCVIDNWWVANAADYDTTNFCEGDVVVAPTTTTTTTTTCGESDGTSDQGAAGRGGWLTALLADTGGGTTGISDYPYPTDLVAMIAAQPFAAPTLAGSLVAGGSGNSGSYVYYAIATVHDGVLSELSNVVGPFTTTSTDKQVDLTWSGLAGGADSVRVFRGSSTDNTFQQFNRYRVTGYPYAVSDVDASETGLTDAYPGIDTTVQLDPDPHWDLNYRQQVYYQISAIFEDGTESSCSAFVEVDLYPRNAPLTVNLSWSAPGAGPSPLVGYRIRRSNQSYSFDITLDRQWDVGPDEVSLIDDNGDSTGAVACAVEAATSNLPAYVVTGHWSKQIREVFVLKPDPDSENKEFVQNLMVEGSDYNQEIRIINGNLYHCLVFTEQQRSDTCQYYKVTVNLDGVETNADGTGELVVSAADVIQHVFLNLIANTYRSGTYFTDVAYAPGLWSTSSAAAAKAISEVRIPGGYLYANAVTQTQSARQLLYDLLASGDFDLYQQQGIWHLTQFDPLNTDRGTLTSLDPNTTIVKDSFEPFIDSDKQFNLMPYFAGPIAGDGANGYLVSGEVRDSTSIALFGILINEPTYLLWTQDPRTAFDVMRHYLRTHRYPPISARFAAPIGLYTTAISTAVAVTHPDGLGAGGWVSRVCRIYGVELDFDGLVTWVTVRDVDDQVP